LITAAMRDICRRAMHCGGVAAAPPAALSTLSVRLQIQFIIHENVIAALFKRVRFVLGLATGLASCERRYADLILAVADSQNAVKVNGGGAHLLSLRTALQVVFYHAWATDQFLTCFVRDADGRQI